MLVVHGTKHQEVVGQYRQGTDNVVGERILYGTVHSWEETQIIQEDAPLIIMMWEFSAQVQVKQGVVSKKLFTAKFTRTKTKEEPFGIWLSVFVLPPSSYHEPIAHW